MRGYYYYLLLRQYGPIVLIKELLPSSADFANMQRAPYDECVKYICDMMDLASDDLPMHYWDNQTRLGRPNKLVCKAVKAIVLNLAASPQFNGNAEYINFKIMNALSLSVLHIVNRSGRMRQQRLKQ